ncbi:hypothetical protein BJX96DRAFT_123703 [Aspergillus floccosus]
MLGKFFGHAQWWLTGSSRLGRISLCMAGHLCMVSQVSNHNNIKAIPYELDQPSIHQEDLPFRRLGLHQSFQSKGHCLLNDRKGSSHSGPDLLRRCKKQIGPDGTMNSSSHNAVKKGRLNYSELVNVPGSRWYNTKWHPHRPEMRL